MQGPPLDVSDQFVAGLGAGVAASMVACPTELIKCRLQAQSGSAPVANAGSPGVSSLLFSQSYRALQCLESYIILTMRNVCGSSADSRQAEGLSLLGSKVIHRPLKLTGKCIAEAG